MFYILGISITFFLVFLLFIKKNKTRADRVLILWLMLMTIHQFFHYYHYTEEIFDYPHLLGVDFAMPVLYGVLLYFYVLEITSKPITDFPTILAHLFPTIILVLLAVPFYILTGPEKVAVIKNGGEDYQWYVITQNLVIAISGFAYSIFSLLRIRQHRLNIQDNYSNTEKKELQWLKLLSIGLGLLWIVVIFTDANVIFSGLVVFILFIGFFGINQLSIFSPNPHAGSSDINDRTEGSRTLPKVTKRYAKSGLNEASAEQLYNRLNQLMSEESLFVESDLTLTELAKRLEVHSNSLSQVINEKEKKNFYHYINALRIEEFIRRYNLPESRKYTLLSVAYDCGFNSKSTFNKHFKENTGKTPTEYFN